MSDLHEEGTAVSFIAGDVSLDRYDATPPSSHKNDALDIVALASWLPRLGAVLWLSRGARRRGARATVGPHGVLLLDHPALNALAAASSVTAHTQLTSHGPREWLAFREASGETIAKLFLLPDTDYLGWDEMIAALRLQTRVEEPRRACPQVALLRNALARVAAQWHARLVTFRNHRLPWLQTLDARAPLRLSLLGIELARAIAAGEGAELPSPLHAI